MPHHKFYHPHPEVLIVDQSASVDNS